jgi:hypothetical protein
MFSKRIYVLFAACSVLILMVAACSKLAPTEDPSTKITEIAATVQAQLTQISALTPSVTPTLAPTATSTPIPETPTLSTPLVSATSTKRLVTSSSGDDARFDKDITIPDNSLIQPGTYFTKTWSVTNSGSTTWTTDYQLVYLQGPQATVLSVKLTKPVAPGETIQISVQFLSPTTLGSYTSWWKLVNANGFPFGDPLSVVFSTGNDTATPTSAATSGTTDTPTPTST